MIKTKAPSTTSYGSTALQWIQELNEIRDRVTATNRGGTVLSLEEALTGLMERMIAVSTRGNKLIFIGNGGSAAIASHQALDYWKNGGFEAVAFNDSILLTCISNDYGYEKVFSEPILHFGKEGDLLVAISSSGQSPNILKAVDTAYQKGCGVVTLSGFEAMNPLRSLGETNFYVPSRSYGIVEVTHLTLLHSLLESYIVSKRPVKDGSPA